MKPKRPEKLDSPRKCGECIYFNSIKKPIHGNCQEIYGVTKNRQACIDFELQLSPHRYRQDSVISQLNRQAHERFSEFHEFLEELATIANDGVFTQKNKSGGLKHPVRVRLEHKGDTSDLVCFYEQAQARRERVTMIQCECIRLELDLDILFERAESLLLRSYTELRLLKPEAIRQVIVNEILSEIDLRRAQCAAVLAQCDHLLRTLTAAHSALLEIQAAIRNATSYTPRKPRSDGIRTGYIGRKV